jgi:hypothetical protein
MTSSPAMRQVINCRMQTTSHSQTKPKSQTSDLDLSDIKRLLVRLSSKFL